MRLKGRISWWNRQTRASASPSPVGADSLPAKWQEPDRSSGRPAGSVRDPLTPRTNPTRYPSGADRVLPRLPHEQESDVDIGLPPSSDDLLVDELETDPQALIDNVLQCTVHRRVFDLNAEVAVPQCFPIPHQIDRQNDHSAESGPGGDL